VAPQTGDDPTPLFDLWGLTEAERLDAFSRLTELVMLEGAELDALDDLTMHEYLGSRAGVPWRLYSYMAMHANASLAEYIDRVAASEQVRILQDIALRGAGGYYRGGFGRVLDDIAEAFRGMGGEIHTAHRVERIRIDDGRVQGVETQHGRIRARAVVSSAGIQPTMLKLVGSKHLDATYLERVRALAPGGGWATVRYFLDAPVFRTGMAMLYSDESWWNAERARRVTEGHVPDEVIVFLTVPAVFDPAMAPPGRQCLIAGTICSSDPKASEIDALYRRVDAMIERVYPEAWKAVVERETDGPAEISAHTRDSVLPGQGGECVGLGQIVGQCGRHKPGVETPIAGLFLAGTDAGAAGMGTHQAATSGMAVARAVLAYLRQPAGAAVA
jgi:phytoene dehydrogenase-like protein